MRIKLNTITSTLFYISFSLITLFSYMGHVNYVGSYLNLLSKISLILLSLIFVLKINSFNRKEIFISFCLLLLSILNTFYTKDFSIFKIIMILLCIRNMNLKKFIKYDLLLRIFIILIMFMLEKQGITKDVIFYSNGVIKHSLGFLNPNNLGLLSIIIFLEFIYLNWEKKLFVKCILFSYPLYYLNTYIGCKTAIYIMILSLLLIIIIKFKKNFLSLGIVKHLVENSFSYLTLISILFFVLYYLNNPIGTIINNIMTTRLYNMQFYFNNYGLSLFGKMLNSELTLDTFYYYIIYGYGFINTIIILISFKLLFKKLYLNNNYALIFVFFIFAIYGLSERLWFNIDYNAFICFFSLILYNDSKSEKQNDNILIGGV